jgi:hypothetical protein
MRFEVFECPKTPAEAVVSRIGEGGPREVSERSEGGPGEMRGRSWRGPKEI